LLPARDVSSLEEACGGLFPKLRWPADGPTAESGGALGIEDLRLAHDAARNALVLRTAAGDPVATPHFGSVPDHLVFGPLRLLFAISNPWVVGSRLSDRAPALVDNRVTAVTFIPRDQRGRLVVRRARWLVPAHLFPLKSNGERDGAYLLRVDAWRRVHGLPEEIFLSVEGNLMTGAFNKDRKPRWVSFSSLHALGAIKGVVSANLDGTLTLVEALPARNQFWARGGDGQCRGTEMMALLRWDSAQEKGAASDGD
jgi:hypothetical protein